MEDQTYPSKEFCAECGAPMEPGSVYCARCGAKLVIAAKATTPTRAVTRKVRAEIRIPYGEITAGILGVVGMIFLFLPYLTISEAITGPPTLNLQITISGLDLAQGVWHYFGMSLPLPFSVASVWLILVGAIIVAIFGFLSVVPRPNLRIHARKFASLVLVAGVLLLAGSVLSIFQIILNISYFIGSPGPGVTITSFVGWAAFGSVTIGVIAVILGAKMLATSKVAE